MKGSIKQVEPLMSVFYRWNMAKVKSMRWNPFERDELLETLNGFDDWFLDGGLSRRCCTAGIVNSDKEIIIQEFS